MTFIFMGEVYNAVILLAPLTVLFLLFFVTLRNNCE